MTEAKQVLMKVRCLLKRDPEQLIELVDEDDDGNPGCETDSDSPGHEADEPSDPEHAHKEQQHTREDGRDE